MKKIKTKERKGRFPKHKNVDEKNKKNKNHSQLKADLSILNGFFQISRRKTAATKTECLLDDGAIDQNPTVATGIN